MENYRYNQRDWRLPLVFLIILTVLLGNAYLSERAIRELTVDHGAITHTWQVKTELSVLRSQVEATESAVRGYVLSGKELFLTTFTTTQQSTLTAVDRVAELTHDNPRQVANTERLRRAVGVQQAFARETVARRTRLGTRWKLDEARGVTSRRLTGEVRAQIQKMEAAEEELLLQRKELARVNEHRTRLAFFGATAMAALFLTTAFLVIQRMIVERIRNEQIVREANARLEQRVAERTRVLQQTNDRLNAVNSELEAFSYSVSHDLRAPLRHVAGFSDLLEKKSGHLLDDSGRRYVGLIRDAAKRAGLLVDDLLAFSRMGRSELHEDQVAMTEMVQALRRELELENPTRTIVWKIEALPTTEGDAAMLRLVWRNLLENAVKYTRPRTEAEIEVGTEQTATEQIYFVRDNGVGFDMAFASKLFGVFQRLHGPDEFEGTGIGLANVRRIVARHGGRTWAESAPGAGATFFFALPRDHFKENDTEDEARTAR